MAKQLVLIGGGHAHMETLAALPDFVGRGHAVTVVAPSPYHYYSGMGPGMLAGTYQPEEIRFTTKRQVEERGGVFVLGRVVRIDPAAKTVYLEDGARIPYDVVSCNAGSFVPRGVPVVRPGGPVFTVKPIEELLVARRQLLELAAAGRTRIAVVGGGPSAVEIAGNAWRLLRDAGVDQPAIRIFAGTRILGRVPEPVRRRASNSLTRRGIDIIEAAHVREIRDGKVRLDSAADYPAEFVFLALGIKPAAIFAASGLPVGPDGGLLVNKYLQSPAHPEIFGGGDCIHFAPRPLDKVGVYAVRQNPILRHNLLAALEGGTPRAFEPGGDYLLIYNLGDDTGIFHKRGLVFGGRPAFWIKDYIDRRFMRRFQAL